MEAHHQSERRLLGGGEAGDPHPGAQYFGAGVEVRGGDASGVAGEFGEFEGEPGGAQVQPGEQLVGEVDLVVSEGTAWFSGFEHAVVSRVRAHQPGRVDGRKRAPAPEEARLSAASSSSR
ncbi:hypothetical protein OG216_47150 (plasmid) [Streptomycetaceae bacterium NBC_01309]